MTNEELRDIAKGVIVDMISQACDAAAQDYEYLGIEDEADIPKVQEYIRELGAELCKSMGKKYYEQGI